MSDWRKSAACVGYDPALWFPGNSQLMRREAIHICHTCPVMMQCRKYAETNNQICGYPLQGIWGVDFLPVLKHRDSGIGVVPVVRVSLTVASSRRGEMESYTVSARV